MKDWKLPWQGGCRCGRLRFSVTEPPLLASACHCTGCQRMTGSAFSLTLTLSASGFTLTAGEPVAGGLHGATRHQFCGYCMSWVFTQPEGLDQFINLRATMLDDPHWVVPHVEVWTSEKLPWASTPAIHSFERQPELERYLDFVREFAETGARPG